MGVVFCCVVLMGHDGHLIKMDLRDVGIRGRVDVLRGDYGEDDGFGCG